MLPKEQPYKNELARLKPFLVSLSRYHMSNIILKANKKYKIFENIIRIQTDGIVLNKEIKFSGDYAPIPETKTTGCFTWHHLNKNDKFQVKKDVEETDEELIELF
jgi:hypothetical protein